MTAKNDNILDTITAVKHLEVAAAKQRKSLEACAPTPNPAF